MKNNARVSSLVQIKKHLVPQRYWGIQWTAGVWWPPCMVVLSLLVDLYVSPVNSWHTDNRCVSPAGSGRPVCSVMQRAGNRLAEGKVKDDLPPPCCLLYTLSSSSSCFLHPSPKSPHLPSPLFLSPPLLQSFCLLGLLVIVESYCKNNIWPQYWYILMYCYENLWLAIGDFIKIFTHRKTISTVDLGCAILTFSCQDNCGQKI